MRRSHATHDSDFQHTGEIVFQLKTVKDFALVRTSKGVEGYVRCKYLTPSVRIHRRTHSPPGTLIREKANTAHQFISVKCNEVQKDEVVFVLGYDPTKKFALIRRVNHPAAQGYIRVDYLTSTPTFVHHRPSSDPYKYTTLRMKDPPHDFVEGEFCDPAVQNGDVIFKLEETGRYSRILTKSGCRGYVLTKYLSKKASTAQKSSKPPPKTKSNSTSSNNTSGFISPVVPNPSSQSGKPGTNGIIAPAIPKPSSSSGKSSVPKHWYVMLEREAREHLFLHLLKTTHTYTQMQDCDEAKR